MRTASGPAEGDPGGDAHPAPSDEIGLRIAELTGVIEGERVRRPRRADRTRLLIASWSAVILALTIAAAERWFRLRVPGYVIMAPIWALLGYYLRLRITSSRRLDEAADALSAIPDRRAIGGLLVAAHVGVEAPVSLQGALSRLLLTLQPSDAGDLRDDDLDLLKQILTRRLNPVGLDWPHSAELVSAAIRALESVGDVRHLAPVHELADGAAWSEDTSLIRDSARHCLPILEARVRAQQSEALLLRPSGAPTGQLLRPAGSIEPAESRTLLHVADSGETEG